MIKGMSHAGIYVLDQDSAKAFYTEKLGFEVHHDVSMGEGFEGAGAGFRWLTVTAPGRPDFEFILAAPEMGHDQETARQIRELVAKGAFGAGVFATDDCRKTFVELSAKASSSSRNRRSGPTASRHCSGTTPGTGSA